jgi:hypothetical protein
MSSTVSEFTAIRRPVRQELPSMSHPSLTAVAHSLERDQRQYRHLVALCLPVFILVALVGRAMPRRWRPFGIVGGRRLTVIGEARHAAHTIIPLVFSA